MNHAAPGLAPASDPAFRKPPSVRPFTTQMIDSPHRSLTAGPPFTENVGLGAAGERASHYSCRVASDQAGRVDSWIWSVRLARTRSAASVACRAGHVRVNGVRVKPAHAIRAGDDVRLRGEGRERVVVVQQVVSKRVSASVAAACYIDNSPPPPPREETGGAVPSRAGQGAVGENGTWVRRAGCRRTNWRRSRQRLDGRVAAMS